MRLGLNLGYWGAGNDADNLVLAKAADDLGYSVCWAAEAYGSDAATVLAWVGAQTKQIGLNGFGINGSKSLATNIPTILGWNIVVVEKPLLNVRSNTDIPTAVSSALFLNVRLYLFRNCISVFRTHIPKPV